MNNSLGELIPQRWNHSAQERPPPPANGTTGAFCGQGNRTSRS